MAKIVDVSHHQGTIDWAKASKELDLVIIRTKYGSKTTDKQYKNNVAGAQKYGVPYGLYHYAQFVSVEDAKREAKDFLTTATKKAKFLVLDVEEQTCNTASELVQATQVFINICKAAGYKVGLYTGHHFYEPYKMSKVEADFLWIPRYSTSEPTMDCDLWQYTDKGSVDGISGNVDLNKLNGNKKLSWFTDDTVVTTASVINTPDKDYHTVVKGDTVSKLATENNTSIAQIKNLNKLDDKYTIRIGQILRVK